MSTAELNCSGSGGNIQRGVGRVLKKLENSIERGEYYEAHQMYRTLYFRYTMQKKHKETLELLYSGATKLLIKEQQSSAADLCLLLIDTLEKYIIDGNSDSNDDALLWISRLGTLITGLLSHIVERETIINRGIKWSALASGNTFGHPILHKIIAQVYWNERNIEQARHHFLLSQDGNLCGRILIQINETKGLRCEVDLFIVQAVLQQLCLKDRQTAEGTFIAYCKNHPLILRKDSPFKYPLLNFVYFLFRLIDVNNLIAFRTMKKLYEQSLNRDPSFLKYLSKIGVIYFGETVAQTPSNVSGGLMAGMLGDIFTRIFQGIDDDDQDGVVEPQQHLPNELD